MLWRWLFSFTWLSLGLVSSLVAHPDTSTRIVHISEQIEVSPNTQALYLQRANVWIMARQYDHAWEDLAAADKYGLTSNSDYYKGVLHAQLQQTTEAIHYFDLVLARLPDNMATLDARAQAYIVENKPVAALSDYRRILSSTSRPAPSHYLDTAKLAFTLSGYHAALDVVDEGIERLGLNPQLQQYAVNLSVLKGNYDSALQRHRSLQPMMRHNPRWYVQHAELLFASEQYDSIPEQLLHAEQLLKPSPWAVRLKQRIAEQYTRLAILLE